VHNNRVDKLLAASLEVIRGCECVQGCPSCAGPVLEVGEKGKESAVKILEKGLEAGGG